MGFKGKGERVGLIGYLRRGSFFVVPFIAFVEDKALSRLAATGCPPDTLQLIWALCNVSPSPGYTLPEFCLAMHLCEKAARGEQVPEMLDEGVVREVQLARYVTSERSDQSEARSRE